MDRSLILLLAILVAVPIAAQSDTGFRLPVELLQGAALGSDAITPYQASIAVIPGYSFDPFRIGAKISLDYDNPSWRTRLGVRLASRVVRLARSDIGLILGGEVTTTVEGDVRLGGGLTFDVDGLIRVGAWGGWEQIHDGGWFGVTFGADPMSWFGGVEDDFDDGDAPSGPVFGRGPTGSEGHP